MSMKHLYAYINIGIIALGVMVFGYWYFIDGVWNPALTVSGNFDVMKLQTDRTTYHRGDTIYIHFDFCKNRPIPANVNWRLVDGQIILFSQVTKNVAVGCYGGNNKPYIVSTITIPENVPYGVWHLEGNTSFEINPIKTQTFFRKTLDFEITP